MNVQKLKGSFLAIAITKLSLTAIAILGISACNPGNGETTTEGQPNVVTTSTIITDWTAEVAQDEINLTGILPPGVDPHIYEPVPRDSAAFEEADLIIYNGYNLEPGLIRIMNAAGVNADKLALGEVIEALDFEEDGEIEPDPHVWGDVQNAIAMVNTLRDRLIELAPESAEVFNENADNYIAQLEELDTWVEAQIATIPQQQRQLITTHDAFQYYGVAYGLEIPGTLIGISTEEQPSARTVQELIETIRENQIPAIFAETTINPALIGTVAEEANVQLAERELYGDSIGAPGSEGDSYINMTVSNTRTIVEALGGEYTPFN